MISCSFPNPLKSQVFPSSSIVSSAISVPAMSSVGVERLRAMHVPLNSSPNGTLYIWDSAVPLLLLTGIMKMD